MLWHIDGGHGWLEVERSELKRLGIETKISSYSFQRGDKVYLEEDCDATIFLDAYHGKDEWWKDTSIPRIKTIDYEGDAPCRNYTHYKV